ncbi:glycosyltransferase [Luteimonas sp. 50]|uniref:Glycosyltransferase n=1 Tax=Cognatiluteimonas sedimenti TaxID=2927791 RepID=A0ABT0A410_9GAMM|nr:glycosyltransferase [Lysobacter sedimenti]MCJ0825709.1 glycosyltransferase [Lysobacter sedimenti]
MSPPRVTVCVATCNQRGFIAQCLRSVVEQHADADLRLLVGDDASDDGTSQIVAALADEYPGTILPLRRPRRVGAFANMRDLIACADGDFVARMDGDDYWLPGKLQRQLDYLQAHADCAAVYTNAITVDAAGNRIGLFNDVGDARFDLAAMLRRGNFLNNSSVLFRASGRRAWLDVEVPQIDYRAHLWHARHGHLAHLGEPLAAYRVATRGSMVAEMNDRVRALYWEAIQSVPRGAVADADLAAGMADFMRKTAFHALRSGNASLVHEWLPRVMAASPVARWRLLALLASSVARGAAGEAWGRLADAARGGGHAVLYRR